MNCIWEQEGTLAKDFWEHGKSAIPIYDMHAHMGSHSGIYLHRCDAAAMVEHARKIGVKRLVFSHHHVLFGEMRNAEVVRICEAYPELLRMYLGINPLFPERVHEDLARFETWRPWAIGLKFLPDYHGVPITDQRYEYALAFANEHEIPILCHTWGGSGNNGGPVMLEAACRYPKVKFFMGHAIYGDTEYARRVVTETPGNVWLELTAVPGDRGRLEQLVESVGSERLLYGTDLPWFDEYQVVGGVLAADITDEDRRNIFYRNIEKLLGEEF